MGGDRPNIADLSVFGVLQAVRGTDTFVELMEVRGRTIAQQCRSLAPGAASASSGAPTHAGRGGQGVVHADGGRHAAE